MDNSQIPPPKPKDRESEPHHVNQSQSNRQQIQNSQNVINHTFTSVQPGHEECPEEIEGERLYE